MFDSIARRDFVKGSAAALAATAVAGSATAALADATAPAYTAGTYTAAGQGVGTVTVELIFDETSITDASVDVSGETPWVGGQLGETLAAALVEKQDGTVDVIAGATMTCEGAMRAAAASMSSQTNPDRTPLSSW